MATNPWLVGALAAAVSSCAAPSASTNRGGIATAPRATFFHAGFGAGPVLFTSAAGALLEERRSEPYGAPVGVPDVSARDLNVLNKRTDAATGWSDHGARWVAPETARWLTPDPPVEGPDPERMFEPWALHPYQYVNQNPVHYWDPDGRDPRPVDQNPAPRWGPVGTHPRYVFLQEQAERFAAGQPFWTPPEGPTPPPRPPESFLDKLLRRVAAEVGEVKDPIMRMPFDFAEARRIGAPPPPPKLREVTGWIDAGTLPPEQQKVADMVRAYELADRIPGVTASGGRVHVVPTRKPPASSMPAPHRSHFDFEADRGRPQDAWCIR